MEAGNGDQNVSKVKFWSQPSSWLAVGHLLKVFSYNRKRGSKISGVSSVGANPLWGPTLMTSSNLNYPPQIPPSNSVTQGG